MLALSFTYTHTDTNREDMPSTLSYIEGGKMGKKNYFCKIS